MSGVPPNQFLLPGSDTPLSNATGVQFTLDFSALDQSNRRVIDPDGVAGGPFYPEVSIDEDLSDELVITRHPVEQGAVISDHAYKNPAQVRMRLGWSNAYGGHSGYVQELYQKLLDLQKQRVPFSLWTGKRQYDNMLVAAIRPHTDRSSEFVLLVDVVFEQIIIVSTQAIAGGAINPNAAQQADPKSSTPTTNSGTVQPVITTYGGAAGIQGLPGSPNLFYYPGSDQPLTNATGFQFGL